MHIRPGRHPALIYGAPPGPTPHSTPESCEVNPLPVPSTVELAVGRASSRRKRPDSVTTGPGLSNRAGFDPAGSPRIDERDPGKGTGRVGFGAERAGTLDTARRVVVVATRFEPFQAAFSHGTRTPTPVFHESARPCSTMPAAHLFSPLWVTVS